ncbi:MAG: hypothetical protein ABEJ98_01010 [Candidatus Nanohaloarchaea archaeon]
MLDAKILVAVLITLAAISTGMNGASVKGDTIAQKAKNIDTSGNLDLKGMLKNPVSGLKKIFKTRPEPTNTVEATLEVEDLKTANIYVDGARFTASNFTSFSIDSKKVHSNEEVMIYGFSGSVKPGEVSEIQGSADGFVTSGVNVSGVMAITEEIDSSRMVFESVERSSLAFSSVTGKISSDNVSTEFGSERPLEINSFSGRMVLIPANDTLKLDGKVDRLEAGKFSYGG